MASYSPRRHRFAQRLRQRHTNSSSYTVGNAYFETRRRLARNRPLLLPQSLELAKSTSLDCRSPEEKPSKTPHGTTPRLPPGRPRTPSANFCALAGIDFFGACHRAVKRPPVLPVRRGGGQGQPRCDISARRDAAAAALARIRRRAANKPNFSGKRLLPARGQAGQPSNQISRS